LRSILQGSGKIVEGAWLVPPEGASRQKCE